MSELSLREIFDNNFDCYTVVSLESGETDIEMAMSSDKFIEVVSGLLKANGVEKSTNPALHKHIVNNCTIHVDRSKCKHLKNISCYNNNYYELPIKILGCNILFEHYDGGEDFTGNCVGFIEDGNFVTKYYLHTNDNDEIFYIDLSTIAANNEWT